MRILRALQPMTKVTVVFVLALTTATTLIIATPRPAQAEGFLLDTVRCLVRTVLVAGCPAEPTSAPAPASSSQPTTQEAAPASGGSSTGTPQAHTKRSYAPVETAPITAPDTSVEAYPTLQEVARPGSGDRMTEAEYIAYFNAHSPYAVQGAQHAASGEAGLVQAGPEGWKLFGVAWYWWGIAAAFIFALFLSVKHGILRRNSVLSE